MKESFTAYTGLSSDEEFIKGVEKKIDFFNYQLAEKKLIRRFQKNVLISRCKLIFSLSIVLIFFRYVCWLIFDQTMFLYGGSILILSVAIIEEYFMTTRRIINGD